MKAYALIVLSLFLLTPLFVLAANDVTLSGADVEITANGVTALISGSHNVDSITVNEGNFSVVLSNSTLVVTSATRSTFTVDPIKYRSSFDCQSSQSILTIERNDTGTDTVTITPTGTTCSASSGGSGGSGGGSGGGGGGGASPAEPATPTVTSATPATPPVAAKPSLVAQAVSPVFNRTLKKGMTHPDVKRLQQLLNSDPDTQITSSGAGSPGNETELFGGLTEDAVKRFQAKYGIATSGTPDTTGYGLVGPGTRAKLNAVFGAKTVTTPAPVSTPAPSSQAASTAKSDPELSQLVELFIALGVIPADKAEKARSVLKETAPATQQATNVSPVFTATLKKGQTHPDVKRLQQLLNSDPDTQITSSGAGSPGNETELFGGLTEDAVKRFQAKYGIATSGTPDTTGYGLVGPGTRAKLNAVFGN